MRVRPPAGKVLLAEHPRLAIGAVRDRRADLRKAVGRTGIVPVEALATLATSEVQKNGDRQKLKTKLAKKQARSDKTLSRAPESRENESPISKVFNLIFRRNSRGKQVAVESNAASALGSSSNDASSGAAESVWSEDTIERLRGLSVQAVVHIGRAARLAPVPF